MSASCPASPTPAQGRSTTRAASLPVQGIVLRDLGRVPYLQALEAMRAFTAARGAHQTDEIWLLEHEPVFTQGLAGKPEHVLTAQEIPVVKTERGGQVTYHGPGQVVAYTLIDLARRGLGVREMVCRLEAAAIETCAHWGVTVLRKTGAPGLYLEDGAKIASLGLKISRGRSYHGIALNVDMNLEPFGRINPCGYAGLPVTDLHRAGARPPALPTQVAPYFGAALARHLSE